MKYTPVITDDSDWGKTQVAGHRVRLWANLTTGRVVIQTDEADPKDVGVAVDLDSPILAGKVFVNTRQCAWANDVRDELLSAAADRFAVVAARGWDTPAA